jgi:hypothetical protein
MSIIFSKIARMRRTLRRRETFQATFTHKNMNEVHHIIGWTHRNIVQKNLKSYLKEKKFRLMSPVEATSVYVREQRFAVNAEEIISSRALINENCIQQII